MNLLVPPPVVTAICVGLMWAVGRFVPIGAFAFPGQRAVTITLLIVALLLMLVAAAQFARAHTTINPMKPQRTSSLVRSGVFAYSRNPIYLADLLLLVAVAIWIGNVFAFAVCPLFISYINRFQIDPEEAALTRLFGNEYASYRRRVRRWL